ncbi:hypothetical protein [Streptomyces sp. NPDC048157]|uniref:hypothetical protein n=1 Tax=Streptomyces sp. NPDC048157 TaxID=3365503 RepID=UPI00371562C5
MANNRPAVRGSWALVARTSGPALRSRYVVGSFHCPGSAHTAATVRSGSVQTRPAGTCWARCAVNSSRSRRSRSRGISQLQTGSSA